MSHYGDTPAGIVESCMEFLRICEREHFPDVVVSIKAIELKKRPALSVLKSRVREAALGVDGVADCAVSVLNLEDRNLTGIALLTLKDGTTANVEI